MGRITDQHQSVAVPGWNSDFLHKRVMQVTGAGEQGRDDGRVRLGESGERPRQPAGATPVIPPRVLAALAVQFSVPDRD